MKSKSLKLIALLIVLVMLLAAVTPAWAETYGEQAGGTKTLMKYLIMDQGTVTPAAEFEFEVKAGQGRTALGNGELPVTAGISPNSVSVEKATFTVGQSATADIFNETGESGSNKIAAVDSFNVDFSGVKFTKPGIYRYVVTEKAVSAPYSKIEGKDKITIDVYVENDENSTTKLKVAGYVTYRGEITANPKKTETSTAVEPANGAEPTGAVKSDKMLNSMASYSLTVQKQITGNQADFDAKFEIKVELSGLTSGNKVKVDSNTTVTGASSDYTAGTDGKVTATLNYGKNDKLVITGIPSGANYNVTETKANADGYETTYTGATSGNITENKTVIVTNEKKGVVPTGVITRILPGAVLIMLAVLLLSRKRRPAKR